MGFLMEKESKYGKMERNTQEPSNMGKSRDKAFLIMQMARGMRATF